MQREKAVLNTIKQLSKKEAKRVRQMAVNATGQVVHEYIAMYHEWAGREKVAAATREASPPIKTSPLSHEMSGTNATLYLSVRIVPKDYELQISIPPTTRTDEELKATYSGILNNVQIMRNLALLYYSEWRKDGPELRFSTLSACLEIPGEFPWAIGVIHFYKIGDEILFPDGMAPAANVNKDSANGPAQQPGNQV